MEENDEEAAAAEAAQGASTSGLKDELCRRLNVEERASQPVFTVDIHIPPRIFCEERHVADTGGMASTVSETGIFSKWRQKEKLKTTAVALVLCLNIGVDPPDVIKISPCARLECWVDPLSMQPARALEAIGKNLQAQYERWQPRAKYKMHLDPTVEDVKKLCLSSRKNARNERVLFHYNGHGVPRPTANGELWVFNARYTQYIPLNVVEMMVWIQTPCIYVLDCSGAGIIINTLKSVAEQRMQGSPVPPGVLPPGDPMREVIALAACGAHEQLPQHPDLPADVFTACLTTPIKVALRWFCSRSLLRHDGLTQDLIDRIPGRQNDRKTPLGELNWIFTAITDTIAWNVLPRALFQKLFRQDLLVASLFRNFLLAERIMVAAGCTPVSYPRLPPTHQHPMWQAWDMAAEMCMLQLPGLLSNEQLEFVPGVFFSEQLTAFELWLSHGSKDKQPPEQLPIVLQVLLSQVHRLRALVLLGRFLDMGAWAVDLALSVGIFPYVLKLLQTTSHELRTTLVFIWCKILALDKSCQADLVKDADVVKDAGHVYFIKYLESSEQGGGGHDLQCKAQAAFVLAMVCEGHPKGQALCARSGLLGVALRLLRRLVMQPYHMQGSSLFAKWLLLALGKLCEEMPDIAALAYREAVLQVLEGYLNSLNPEIRAAAVFALGALVCSGMADPDPARSTVAYSDAERFEAERQVAWRLLRLVYDASPLVRCELAVALSRFASGHAVLLHEAIASHQRKVADYMKLVSRSMASEAAAGGGPEGGAPGELSHAQSMPHSFDDTVPGTRSRSFSIHKSASAPGGRHSEDDQELMSSSGSNGSRGGQMPEPGGPPSPQSAAASRLSMSDPLVGWSDPTLTYAMDAGIAGLEAPGGGGYAPDAPDAARDAAHLYSCLLETVLVLATDPSPKVARLGQEVLHVAHCELAPMVMAMPAASTSGGGGGGSASSGSVVGSPMRSSAMGALGSLTARMAGRKGPWRATPVVQPPPSSRPLGRDSLGSASAVSSSPASPTREMTPVSSSGSSRHPYILRTLGFTVDGEPLDAGQDPRGPSSSGRAGGMPGRSMSMPNPAGGTPGAAAAGPVGGAPPPLVGRGRLPPSQIFKASCEYFSRPMLEPMSSAWRETEGTVVTPWTQSPNPRTFKHRVEEIDERVRTCRSATQPRLRDQVFSVDFGGEYATSVSFHSFRPLIAISDDRGYIRVHPFADKPDRNNQQPPYNTFHVTDGSRIGATGATARVVFLHQINEMYSSMLLTGCADGAVRLYRNYTLKNEIRLASAWQAAPTNPPPFHVQCPATFAWSDPLLALYAAGGTMPEGIHRWDVNCERMVQVIHVRGASAGSPSGAGPGGPSLGVERMALSQEKPHLLLAQCLDGGLRIFDIRSSQQPAAVLRPFRESIAGAVLDPSTLGQGLGRIIAGSTKGELKFIDLRMAHSGEAAAATTPGGTLAAAAMEVGVTRAVDAHSKGNMTALVAHPHAPLIATGTANQVVKIWNPLGEAVGAIRQQPSAANGQRVAPISCLVFHPYQLMLAAAGVDSNVSVYMMNNAPSSSAHRASSVTSSTSGS